MLSLKPGVRLLGLRPELLVALLAADGVWAKHGSDLIVTAVIDGTHKRSSAHYTGCAADLRIHGMTDPQAAVGDLKQALGDDFDVILENPGTPNAHCHVEFDPKLAY